MRVFLCPLFAVLACGGSTQDANSRPGESRPGDRVTIKNRFELPTGLSVVVQENHSSPVIAIQAWVRAGTADEEPGEEGVAHLFERLIVDADMFRRAEATGGTLSTRAGHDYTWVQAVVSHRDFQTGAELVAQALSPPHFKDGELEREVAAMRDEVRRNQNTPAQRLTRTLFETVYTTHPYRRSLEGSDDALKQVTRAKIASFYQRHYSPKSTVLVVTGDASPQEARSILERAFKDYNQKEGSRAKRPKEPEQTGPRTKIVEFPTTDAYVSVAWPIPGIDHKDATALSLLAVVLGQGHGSRLSERLTKDPAIASDVYGFSYTPIGPGMLAVGFVAQSKNAQEAASTLVSEVDRIRREVISEAELRRAKAIALGDTYSQKETVEGRASKAGFFQAALGDASVEDRFGNDIEKVTVADLKRVAALYLSTKALNLVALVPKNGKDLIKGNELIARGQALDATYAKRDDVKLPKSGKLGVYRVKLPSGTTVLMQPDRTVPIVAVRAAFVGGQRYEDKATNGIHALLARILPRGTERRSVKEVAALKETLAASIEGFSSQNAFGLYAEFLKSTAGEGLDLLSEMLQTPRFYLEDTDRERAVLLSEIRSREDHAPSAVFDMMTEALYDSHPYRLRQKGSVDAVSALRENELSRFYKHTYTRDRLVIALVGDFEPEDMLAQVSRLFGSPREKGDIPKPPATETPLDKPRVVERMKNRQQAVAVLGFRGAAIADKDRYALELLATILGGEGGRLAKALKDKVATHVASVSVEGLEPGYFATFVETSADKLPNALEALKKELVQVQQSPVNKDELERARRFLLGAHAISLQRASSRAASLALNELFGNGFDEDATFDEEVNNVNAADVQRVAKDYLEVSRSVLAVIKPGKK
jgi:zinc protease